MSDDLQEEPVTVAPIVPIVIQPVVDSSMDSTVSHESNYIFIAALTLSIVVGCY